MNIDISKLPDWAMVLIKKKDLDAYSEKLLAQSQIKNKSINETPELLDINGAAKVTGYAKQTIYQKVSNQEIPFIKRGRKLWFERSALLAWIQEGRQEIQSDNEVEIYLRRKNKGGIK